MNTIRLMTEKLKGTPAPQLSSDMPGPLAHSQQSEEARRRTLEMELSNYLAEPLLQASTDATMGDLLLYWRVRMAIPFITVLELTAQSDARVPIPTPV